MANIVYENPGWQNDLSPAIDADNLNDLCDVMEEVVAAVNSLNTTLAGYSALQQNVTQNTQNITSLQGSIVTAFNLSIPTSAWVESGNLLEEEYLYRAPVAVQGVTGSYVPMVFFEAADALNGNFSPTAECGTNVVYVRAKTVPTAAVPIPSVVCLRANAG